MGSRIYVGNLSFNTNEEGLRMAFEADGRSVKEVTVMMDRETGQPRGFGFVEMGSAQDAESAINALDGSDLDGRTIKVNEAKERQSRGGGGGGGYGGGGGGGRGGGGGGYGGGYGGGGGGGGGYGGGGGGGDRW